MKPSKRFKPKPCPAANTEERRNFTAPVASMSPPDISTPAAEIRVHERIERLMRFAS